ncbi:MAG: hypothetical protein K9M99_03675 [Candidatus Cloacimonetes bacterium]|nr:hypothetical protein [Candidatus Cloacimonadota bacterium]
MALKIRRKEGLFFLVEKDEEIPVTRDVFFMAVRDKIKMVNETGDHRNFPYSEILSVLEYLLLDENLQFKNQKAR